MTSKKTHSDKLPLRIVPLGGLGEIGMNCMILEYDDEILIIDCGVLFSDLQLLGVDFFIPDMQYLKDRKDKIAGYIITHGHEDHIGALPYFLKSCPAPVYCSPFASELIFSKLEEHGLGSKTEFIEFEPAETIEFDHFKVTPHPVNHSIVESFALMIDTPQGMIVHTGDFKMDNNPFYGKPFNPQPFIDAGNKGVRLLLSDSTNVERDGCSQSEGNIYPRFEEILVGAKGLTIIAMFASNVSRVGQIVEIAKKHRKKIALLGRSMEQNAEIAYDLGYLEHLYEVLIPLEQIDQHLRKDVVILSTGSQGEYRSGLARVASGEHKQIKLRENDLVVMSSRFIPGNEKPISRMINSLFRLGADVIYESIANVHVSGHANAQELTQMMQFTKPEFFVPVHGEYRHLVKHKKLAEKNQIPAENSIIAVNGSVLELDAEGLRIAEQLEENRIMIEGATGDDVTKVIIKDRRKVAETGIVFAIVVRNSVNGNIMAGPDILSRGFLEQAEHNDDLIEDAKDEMVEAIEDWEEKSPHDTSALQEEIRVRLRRFFNNRIGKKPVVMTIVVDV